MQEFNSENIQEIIEQKDLRKLKNILTQLSAPDIVDLLQNLDEPKSIIILFRLLQKPKAAEVFAELNPDKQEIILKQMSNNQIKEVILELPPDDRTELFEELPGQITQKLLNILPYQEAKEALALLGYPEESVGRLMTPDYIAVRPEWTIEKALEHIRIFGSDAETIDMVYVVDNRWHLLDSMPLRRLIIAQPDRKVESLMDYKFRSISAFEDQEVAAKQMGRYDLIALPVTDSEGILLGIVTIDDIFDVLEEEVTEDFHKGAGVAPLEINYMTASPWILYRKRVIWLAFLLVAGFISSTIISHFENTLEAIIALAFFIPVLIDSGGNTATQSATLIIRALALEDLTLKKWFRATKKELITGSLLGSTLGAVFLLRSIIFGESILLGLTLAISMVMVVIIANLMGAILPIFLYKLKLDPAVISSPLLTTIIDSAGLIIYFTVASIIFGL